MLISLYLSIYLSLIVLVSDDRLHFHIRDGIRYLASNRKGKKILDGVAQKKSAGDVEVRKAKKTKAMYMVNPHKFSSTATESELSRELTEDDLGLDETHRILQCKIT